MIDTKNYTYTTYDDVLLLPKYSDIESRSEIDLSQPWLNDSILQIPIVSANMDYVTGIGMAAAMLRNGGYYVLHRFEDFLDTLEDVDALDSENKPVSFSIGIRNPDEEFKKVVAVFGRLGHKKFTVTVDVAHGHHQKVYDMVERLKDFGVTVIAGNVATAEGFKYLAYAGADAIKVGIGPGSVCTTREVTGVGVPQLSAIRDAVESRETGWPQDISHVKIIADGGIKNSGDIVKALAAGADAVMLGSLLAGTEQAPGEVRTDPQGQRWRPYRGQSIFGVNGYRYTPEGVEGWVAEKGDVGDVLRRLVGGIRSGMSYVGARNLTELRQNAEFIRVSDGTRLESSVRVAVD